MSPARAAALALLGLAVGATPIWAPPARAAGGPARDPVQAQLDALARHDLCARTDAELRSLSRALARRPNRPPAATGR